MRLLYVWKVIATEGHPHERGKSSIHYKEKNKKECLGSCTPVSFTSVSGENMEQVLVKIYRYMKIRRWLGAAGMDLSAENHFESAQLPCVMKWLSLCTRGEKWLSFTLNLPRLPIQYPVIQIRAAWTRRVVFRMGWKLPEPSDCKGYN